MRVLILSVCLILISCAAWAEPTVLWQIGEFDNDFKEFAIAGTFNAYPDAFPKDVSFQVGKDDPAKAWPYIHPGPADHWAGSRLHPFTVTFSLREQPKGICTLVLDFINVHGGLPPVCEVKVNGRDGRVALQAGEGDGALRDPSAGVEHVARVPVPASFLQEGENTLVLTTFDGAWMVYDGLRLENDPEGTMPVPRVNGIGLEPTVRFVKEGSKLMQVVELTVDCTPGFSDLTAVLKQGEKSSEVKLSPDMFGEGRYDLPVDVVTEPTPVEVIVDSGGRTLRASCEVTPQRRWTIYVQPSSHVDIGYTDFQERVVDLHNSNMSLALELCRDFPGFVWNTEVAWVEDNYLSMMPEKRKQEFIKYASEGRLGCQALYGNMLTGALSHEEFIRSLYYAHAASKEHGIPFDTAMISDVPTQVWTLPTVLAGAGIKYYTAGLNLTRGGSFNKYFNRSPFYWQGPDGSRVLTWINPGYGGVQRLGLASSVAHVKKDLESRLRSYDREDYPYDAILVFGGFFDNQPLVRSLGTVSAEWNERYAYPKIAFCRGPEFFEYVESNFGDQIPTYSGCGGVYWEDGVGSSSKETAAVRLAKEQLASAEKAHSLASLLGAEYPRAEINQAWKDAILYDEHTWGAWCSIEQPEAEQTVGQWERKKAFADNAARDAERILNEGMDALAKSVKADEPSVLVFNPLGWAVTGVVDADPGRFTAKDVPPLGYALYPLDEVKPVPASERKGDSPVIENRFYRLEVDPATGAVKSLYDKELKRELVDSASAYGINQYIYMKGQDNGGKDVTREGVTSAVKISSEARPPYGRVLSIEGSAYNTPKWTTEIVLHDDIKRIDFINKLDKTATTEKEAGYFAFPFDLKDPEFYVELPNGVSRPKKDMLDGACMQWYCAQDFVAAEDGECAVVWTAVDSPLITIGDINRESFKSPLPIENGHLYAYVFNNYWFTNYKASQGGELSFRFSLTSMPKYDPADAARFGQSVRNPLIARVVQPSKELSSGKVPASLASVAPSNVIIQAVKKPESGDGLIIRLREVAGKETRASLMLPVGRFRQAWACNLVEGPQGKLTFTDGKVTVQVSANSLATVLVR